MAKFVKGKEKITLTLTYADVWKAWCEKRHYFMSPVQVAAKKGMQSLGIAVAKGGIKTKPIEGGVEITYYLTTEAVFEETSMVQLELI